MLLLMVFGCTLGALVAAGLAWTSLALNPEGFAVRRLAPVLPEVTAAPVAESTPEESAATVTSPAAAAGAFSEGEVFSGIAYISTDGQVGIARPDGSGKRQLTNSPFVFQFPAWSPDGRAVAVVGGGQSGAGVFALNVPARDSTPRQLYFDDEESSFYLYWSPDSRFITFLANHPDGLGLRLVAADGSASSRLLTTGQPLYWDWLPDGERLFIHTGFSGEGARLAFLDVAGSEVGENISPPGFFQAPGVSASGRYWAFAEAGDNEDSYLIIQGEDEQRLAEVRHNGQVAMGWSPAADKLAFTSPDTPGLSFWGPLKLLDAANGRVRAVIDATVLAFFWSPDGQWLAFFTPAGDNRGIEAIRLPGRARGGYGRGGSRTAPTSLSKIQQPERLQLDLWVVHVETGEERFLKRFEPSALFLSQFIPFFDQYALSHRLWSPESDALVIPGMVGGQAHIEVVPIDGRAGRIVADGVSAFWSRQ